MLISPAYAQAAGGADAGLAQFLPLILIFVVFYFLMIRPQQKRAKQHKEMLAAIRRGDNIVTSGGIIGKVTKVDNDEEVSVEIAENTTVKVRREFIASVTSKTEPAKGEESNDNADKKEETGGLKKLFGGKKD